MCYLLLTSASNACTLLLRLSVYDQTVLNVADFAKDWRFRKNPQIEAAQMHTYAGTPLCYTAEDTG